MVFSQLLINRSFAYFLQFHNESLPTIIAENKTPCLYIDNYEYKLRLNSEEFICYNWADKKLIFGKGQPRNFDGKEIRFFDSGVKMKSLYVGVI